MSRFPDFATLAFDAAAPASAAPVTMGAINLNSLITFLFPPCRRISRRIQRTVGPLSRAASAPGAERDRND